MREETAVGSWQKKGRLEEDGREMKGKREGDKRQARGRQEANERETRGKREEIRGRTGVGVGRREGD